MKNKFGKGMASKGLTAGVAAIALVIVCTAAPARAAVGSTVDSICSKISSVMGFKNNDDSGVVKKVDESGKMENAKLQNSDTNSNFNSDIVIGVSEAALDGDDLYVALDFKVPGAFDKERPVFNPGIKVNVNGTDVNAATYERDFKKADNDNATIICSFDLSSVDDLSGDVNIKLSTDLISYEKDGEMQMVSGDWSKEFTVNSKALDEKTAVKTIDQEIKVSDDFVIHLDKTRTNQFGQKIDFTYNGEISHNEKLDLDIYGGKYFEIELEGTDNLGNKVALILRNVENGRGQFVYDFDECHGTAPMNQDAASFTLQAIGYIPVDNHDGTIGNTVEKIGEPFTVETK